LNKIDGMEFNIIDNSWKISEDTSVNYIVKLFKD
jgi:2-polyprenyl-6-hydroxyphenyl methylase / 3-demethylubiquinone-9 3-methyltransferase